MSSYLDKKGHRIVFVWNFKKLGFQTNKQYTVLWSGQVATTIELLSEVRRLFVPAV